ncbi:MAG: L-lactate dehydrogenase [bacterium]|nr:L-lactate dehydrogenase [bacterium]
MKCDTRKVGIIGMGKVGITAAYALLLRSVVDELVLVSRSLDKAEGEKLDLEHGQLFLEPAKITATDDYAELAGSDVIIITAGAAQKPRQSRLDLVTENRMIMTELLQEIKPYVDNAVIVVVSNPVDILTYQIAEALELPKGRVLGTGTMLDTARFRFHLSEVLHVHPRSIHSYILGEHGDSSFPTLASATVGGQPLAHFPNYSSAQAQQAFIQTREAAAQIIQAKGATYYAIGVVITNLVKTILHDQRSVLPISTPVDEYYGQSQLSVSVPCVIGRNGVEQILKIKLSEEEQQQFAKSCAVIKQFTK